MSEQNDSLVAKFKDLVAGSKISLSDAVEVAEEAMASTETKFKDFTYDGKTFRVEGETVEVGAVIMEVMEDETTVEVADGEYPMEEVGVIVVTDSKVAEIKPIEEEEVAEEVVEEVVETFNAEASYEDLMKKFDELKEMLTGLVDNKATDEKEMKAEFSELIREELKNIPALSAENTKQAFSEEKKVVSTNDSIIDLYKRK